MNELPSGWGDARLGEVAKIAAGGSAPQGESYFGGPHPFVRVQHLDPTGFGLSGYDLITEEAVKKYKLKPFRAGTIIFPKSGASIRLEKRALLPLDSYLVSHLCAVQADPSIVDPDYLFYALVGTRFAKDKADGYPTLSLREIQETVVPLPALPEQRGIAHVLRTVQRAKEATEKVVAALKELKKSLMRHLFTYGPVPFNQTDKMPLKEAEIGPIPEHWSVEPLETHWESQLGKMLSPRARAGKSPRPYLRNANVQWGRIELGKLLEMDFEDADYDRYGLVPGDVLICEGGEVGRTAIWKGELQECYYQKALHRLRPRSTQMSPEFLLYHMMHAFRIRKCYGEVGTVTTIAHLPGVKLKALPIPGPPVSEQREIAARLAALEAKLSAEEKRWAGLEALFQSLLNHLMTGRIRVPDSVGQE